MKKPPVWKYLVSLPVFWLAPLLITALGEFGMRYVQVPALLGAAYEYFILPFASITAAIYIVYEILDHHGHVFLIVNCVIGTIGCIGLILIALGVRAEFGDSVIFQVISIALCAIAYAYHVYYFGSKLSARESQ